MTEKATIKVILGIQGPILCKATASSAWGIDATFDRDFQGKPFIDRSHIKGKLREALTELEVSLASINSWLGSGSEDSEPGMLIISDFYLGCNEDPATDSFHNRLTRTRMDRDRGVVYETALLFMENAFPRRNTPYLWEGSIEFASDNEESARKICEEVTVGLKWITAVGSEKTIGLGKLISVETNLTCENINIPSAFSAPDKQHDWLTIVIEAIDPIMIGGIKRKANYLESETIITGGIIKGALAAALNSLCGVDKPTSIPVDISNSKVVMLYPELTRYFTDIRFTHAFPTTKDARPVVIPYSAVAANGKNYDVALCEEPQTINGIAPIFQTDWKDTDYTDTDSFGWASPRCIAKTRTAIDPELRKAEDGKMFTYQYVCPVDCDNNKVVWRGFIRLPQTAEGTPLQSELVDVISRITHLGKRRSKVRVSVVSGKCSHAQVEKSSDPLNEGVVIVTLQSDALMVNPDDLKNEQTAKKLKCLYEKFWTVASNRALTMKRFFAHQRLLGGYLVLRRSSKYYPFYLTGAGSVFILEVSDKTEAAKKIDEWKVNGLPLPQWAISKYKNANKPLWYTCPFVPENGYGEVMVNLRWHFDKRIEGNGGAK